MSENQRTRLRNILAEMSSEATDFYERPVTAFDPKHTRDFDNFHYQWGIFLSECKRLLIDYLQLTIDSSDTHWKNYATDVVGMVSSVLGRVKGYERGSGQNLLHRLNKNGHLVLHLSLLDIIRTCKTR